MTNKEFALYLEDIIKQENKSKYYQVRLYAKDENEMESNFADLLLVKYSDGIGNTIVNTKAFLLKEEWLKDKKVFIKNFIKKLN